MADADTELFLRLQGWSWALPLAYREAEVWRDVDRRLEDYHMDRLTRGGSRLEGLTRDRSREEGILADELRRCLTEYASGSGYDRQDEIRVALRAAGWPDSPWPRQVAAGPPAVGTRVAFVRPFGDFPLDPMPAGTSGEVTEVNDHNPFIVVRLDQWQEQLAEWDNEYHFSGSSDESLAEAVADYRDLCRETYVPGGRT